jgi:two-component system KDP operon response regulator KdpE
MSIERILAADDEPKYLHLIRAALRALDYEVVEARTGREAVAMVGLRLPVLVLLDVRMPEMNGLEACRRIREFSAVPIILLTALAEPADVVEGLEAGADDYITKPFRPEILLARVRAVLRRGALNQGLAEEPVFDCGPLRVDYAQHAVSLDGKALHLTPTEYQVLAALTRKAGRVVPNATIVEQVWGADHAGEEELVRGIVHRLRNKLEPDPAAPRWVVTAPGVGYLFDRRS